MATVLASIAVDRVFEYRSGQSKDYKIGICCFSAKHIVLSSRNKDWLAGIRIMCLSGVRYLSVDGSFSELEL